MLGSRLAVFWVRLTVRPKFVRTISAPCSWAAFAAAKAIDCGVSTPVISSFFPSSSIRCSYPAFVAFQVTLP